MAIDAKSAVIGAGAAIGATMLLGMTSGKKSTPRAAGTATKRTKKASTKKAGTKKASTKKASTKKAGGKRSSKAKKK